MPRLSYESRELVYNLWKKLGSTRKVAEHISISKSTVANIVKEFTAIENGTYVHKLKKDRGKGRRRIDDKTALYFVHKMEKAGIAITLKDAAHFLKVSISTVSRCFKRLKVRERRTLTVHKNKDRKANQDRRVEYFKQVIEAEAEGRHILYGDESAYYEGETHKTSWNLRDHRTVVVGEYKPKRTSSIASLIYKGDAKNLIAPMVVDGSFKGEDIAKWLTYCGSVVRPYSAIVLDNAGVHKTEEVTAVRAMLFAMLNIKTIFLSPYSPELSDIEHVWHNGKSLIVRKGLSLMDFLRSPYEHGYNIEGDIIRKVKTATKQGVETFKTIKEKAFCLGNKLLRTVFAGKKESKPSFYKEIKQSTRHGLFMSSQNFEVVW